MNHAMNQNDQNPESKTAELVGIPYYAHLISKSFRSAETDEIPDQERSPEELLLRWSSEIPTRSEVDFLVQQLKIYKIEPIMDSLGTDIKVIYRLKQL